MGQTQGNCRVTFQIQSCGYGYTSYKVLDQIDTETTVTIGSIRRYAIGVLCLQCRNGPRYDLYYQNRRLDNDNWTLADYGWVSGTSGTIILKERP